MQVPQPIIFGASRRQTLLPLLVIAIAVALTVVLLKVQGRLWICACGRIDFWSGNVNSSDNSQHLFDPYSFTHVLHGLLFYGALAWVVPRLSVSWRLAMSVVLESLWEVVENSAVVIERYRETTLALGYEGDTVVNVTGDLLCMAAGFWLARKLGFRRSVALFLLTELMLIVWIRDSLILNIIMLLFPIDALKNWQMG